jgi:hypothetical protein
MVGRIVRQGRLIALVILAVLALVPNTPYAQDVIVFPPPTSQSPAAESAPIGALYPLSENAMPTAVVDHVEYQAHNKLNIFAPSAPVKHVTVALINIPEPLEVVDTNANSATNNLESIQTNAIPQKLSFVIQNEALPSTLKPHPRALSMPTASGVDQQIHPMGLTTTEEDDDLAHAIEQYRKNIIKGTRFPESHAPLRDYVQNHPESPWRFAILAHTCEAARRAK